MNRCYRVCSEGGLILEAVKHILIAYTLLEDSRDLFKAAVAFYPMCLFTGDANINLLILIGDQDDWSNALLCKEDPPESFDEVTEVIVKVFDSDVELKKS